MQYITTRTFGVVLDSSKTISLTKPLSGVEVAGLGGGDHADDYCPAKNCFSDFESVEVGMTAHRAFDFAPAILSSTSWSLPKLVSADVMAAGRDAGTCK